MSMYKGPNTQDIETPQWLFEWLDKEFEFTLDVAASNENAKCKFYHTKETDGLSKHWGLHSCFMNPPYDDLWNWCKHAYNMSQEGALVVGLLPVRTSTHWFHSWIYGKAEIRFPSGRLFPAQFDSMIVIWRPLVE